MTPARTLAAAVASLVATVLSQKPASATSEGFAPPTVNTILCATSRGSGPDPIVPLRACIDEQVPGAAIKVEVVDASAKSTDPASRELCLQVAADRPLTGTADVVVTLARGTLDPDSEGVRTAFRWDSPEVVFEIEGRPLHGRFSSKVLQFPARRSNPGETSPQAPECHSLRGLVRALAWRRIRAVPEPSYSALVDAYANRTAAATELAAADSPPVQELEPMTAAVIKQIRATVLAGVICDEDTPAELMRAAARLVPGSAEAHGLAAIARLREAYHPVRCVARAERELYAALELDPWGDEAAANLGVLYELSLDARPESGPGEIAVSDADHRLTEVWKDDRPKAPWTIEAGAAASLFAGFLAQPAGSTLRAFAPGGRAELTYARDGAGCGGRASVNVPWRREIPLKEVGSDRQRQGTASWTRLALGVGPRCRAGVGALYGEVMTSFLVASVLAVGQDFDRNRLSRGWDVGGELGFRLGRRFGNIAAWSGLSMSYFWRAGHEGDSVEATNAEHREVPPLDLAATVGMSIFLWR
jgi:hypothetical protein